MNSGALSLEKCSLLSLSCLAVTASTMRCQQTDSGEMLGNLGLFSCLSFVAALGKCYPTMPEVVVCYSRDRICYINL